MSLKLYYFALPGRGEVARLALNLGKVDFEEVIVDQTTWPQLKPTTPFGQVPILELPDGKKLAQSGAIDRYVAKLAGLYPEDPLQAALADQAAFHMADLWDLFSPTFRLQADEKIKARQEILATKGKEKLQQLAKLVETPSGFVAGDKLSYGDLIVYVYLCNLTCGFLDGVPSNLLDEYPVLKEYRNKIASLPGIKEFYEKRGEGLRAAFKPDSA
ncbi:hypothetical protein GPECTOR_39g398 [Gonium pectorale]|uniref:Uncharacterized protein n=1 Tax=Gonium pectorale TaxID=33097 RepID=A0A150GAP4_GONPE|nr:hypothetical protein GPECTOR_39g398 [Gonium pectorale]|eukprot:KXZ46904.1 hypothetical protein GPECTOR_39g398 [Gonium pectorale]